MTNPYYSATGEPGTGAFAASAPMRSEFNDIEDGFDKMPALTASTAVVVNGAGTALANTVGTLALAGNFATTGAFSTTLVAGASVSITLPIVSGLTLATLTGTETLSNKTLVAPALGTPISGVATNLTGTAAGLTAGSVTTNANLTGPITSVGNATAVAAQTGTGSTFVMNSSPTLVTPVLGIATATSINGLAITTTTGTLTLANGSTLATSGAFVSTFTFTGATSVTFPTSGTLAVTGATVALTVGSSTISGGTTTRILYDNAGVLGEYTLTGSGTVVAMQSGPTFTGTVTIPTPFTLGAVSVTSTGTQINYLASATGTTGTTSTNLVFSTSPTLVTPVLGVATATSVALNGATIGTNALAVTGTATISTSLALGGATIGSDALGITGTATISSTLNANGNVLLASASLLEWNADLIVARVGAASMRLGAAAVDTGPVAQTISVQNTLAGGTSNVAGADFTIKGSQGKGTGAGGNIIFQVAPAGSTGTTVNGLQSKLIVAAGGGITVGGGVGNAAISFGSGFADTSAISNINSSGNDTIWQERNTGNTVLTISYATGYLLANKGVAIGATDAFITRKAAASMRLGAAAVDTGPVAQTLAVQDVLAGGTSDVAGANFTIAAGQGKGTGAGGSILFQTAPAGSTGTTVNALVTALTIASTGVTTGSFGSSTATTQAQATNNTTLSTTGYADRTGVQQKLSSITGAVATGTTVIPFDDSIPQSGEGDQYMSLAITPKSATSTLKITVVWNGTNSNVGPDGMIIALFQDSTADALAAATNIIFGAGNNVQVILVWEMTSGTTSATTFKVRAGSGSVGTTTFNGFSGGRIFGGVLASSITIEEIGI